MPFAAVRPLSWLAVLLAGLALAACSRESASPRQPAPASFATITVAAAPRAAEQAWDGVVEAVHDTTLAAQTNARVLTLPVDVGDRVAKGEVLVRFSDVEQQAGRRAAAAGVAAAQATARDAEANWRRVDDIFAKGLVSRAEHDAARARRDAARANLVAAEAGLRGAGQQADYTVLRAPFAGIVTRRFVEPGQAVQSGPPQPQPLLALAALDALRVEVRVPQSAVAAIRARRQAVVELDDGRRVAAAGITVFPWADPATHSFRIRVELPADISDLYPGMAVKVVFAVGEASTVALPATAITQRGELASAWVMAADGSVALRQLRLGRRLGTEREVLAGLAVGERVVRDPAEALAWVVARRAEARR